MKFRTLTCPICGINFTPFNGSQKYCNTRCRNKAGNMRAGQSYEVFHRSCVICGKEFDTKYKRKITCSDDCSIERKRLTTLRSQKAIRAAQKEAKEKQLTDIRKDPVIVAERAYHESFIGKPNALDETLKTMKDPVMEYAARQKANTLSSTHDLVRLWMDRQIE